MATVGESVPDIDFTARDWSSNVDALVSFVRNAAPDSWNSFFTGDLGSTLIEAIAYDATMLSFSFDIMVNECFLDTLRFRESVVHFSRLTGYRIRRNVAASVECLAETTNPPASPNVYRIKVGDRVRSSDGTIWEIAEESVIKPGAITPVITVLSFGDIKGRNLDENGVVTEVDAYIKIEKNTSHAILVDIDGNRFPSEVNFGAQVGQGHILKLTSTYLNPGFGAPPDVTRDEYAIVDIGELQFDQFDNSVLFLDRVWDLDDFLGKYTIENRGIQLVQGETKSESLTGPSDQNERKGHQIRAAFSPIISANNESFIQSGFFGDVEIENPDVSVVVNGVLWRQVASLLFETSSSKAYEVEFDEEDRALITFGDGQFGALIPADATIEIKYRVGGGAKGNVPQNSFNTTISVSGGTGQAGSITVTNPYTVGSGGQDRETIQSAKNNITSFVRTNDRAVTVADYQYLSSNFVDPKAGRVKLAKGVLHKNAVPREQNVVWVYTWVEGANGQLVAPTIQLKRELLEYLDQRKMITDEVVIVDGIQTPVPIEVLFKYGDGIEEWEIIEQTRAIINDVFVKLQPGETLKLGSLYEAVESLPDVENVVFYHPFDNLPATSEFELFSNTVQVPRLTRLTIDAFCGDDSVVVENPSLFSIGGIISFWQLDQTPTISIIEAITGNTIILRPDTPLKESYRVDDCEVLNTDFNMVHWQYEAPVDLYVRYDTLSGDIDSVSQRIHRDLYNYFTRVLRPEESLQKSSLETVVSRVPNVTEFSVNIGAYDATLESVNASAREKIILGSTSINGITY